MARYIVRRLLWVILVVVIVTLVTFTIFYVLPSTDPAIAFAGRQPSPELIQQVRKNLGLDHSTVVQYGIFVKHLFLGDQYGWPGFGKSFNTGSIVRDQIFQRLQVTLQLAIGAAVIWLLMGISVGVLSALKPRSWGDRTAMGIALLGVSTPVFFLAIVALYVFWQKLGWSPGTGYKPLTSDPVGWLSHMWLPWIVLALLFAAIYARVVRGNMIETMHEDYIRTARAKGLRERRVVARHGLRASLTPVVSLFGIDFALLIGGAAIVTESVFNIPGIGNYLLTAAKNQDLPITLAVTVVAAFFVAFFNLIVDIVYGFLDPRVRYS